MGPVLQVTDDLAGGGTERVILHLATSLRARGVEVAVQHSQGPYADPVLYREFDRRGLRRIPWSTPHRYSPGRLWLLRRLVAREGYAILHTHTADSLRYSIALRLLLPGCFRIVHTQHTRVSCPGFPTWGWWQRLLAPRADLLCAVSPGLRADYAALGVTRSCLVIPNGVPAPAKSLNRAEARACLQPQDPRLDPEAIWAVCLGRLHRLKGQRHLLELWKQLGQRLRSRMQLVMLGAEEWGCERRELEERVQDCPDRERVLILPHTPCPELWLQAADVCLSGSEFEGQPLAALEAISCGTPLLVSDIPGHHFLGSAASYFRVPLTPDSGGGARAFLESLAADPGGARERFWEATGELRRRHGLEALSRGYLEAYAAAAKSNRPR